MRPSTKRPFAARSWMIALFIGLVFAGLECGLRFEIKDIYVTDVPSWLDLTLLLGGYLFVFCLKPIRKPSSAKCASAQLPANTGELPTDG